MVNQGHSRYAVRAVTLIELLIVVAIISILAAIAIPNMMLAQTRAKISRAQADIRTIATALEAYRTDHLRYPGGPNIFPEWLTTPVAYISTFPKEPFARVDLAEGSYSVASAEIAGGGDGGLHGKPEGFGGNGGDLHSGGTPENLHGAPKAGKNENVPGGGEDCVDPGPAGAPADNYYTMWSFEKDSLPTNEPASIFYEATAEVAGAWAISSRGPDNDPNNRAPATLTTLVYPGPAFFDGDKAMYSSHFRDYDPTNGANSTGNVFRTQKNTDRFGTADYFYSDPATVTP